jgi:hypothetical protein
MTKLDRIKKGKPPLGVKPLPIFRDERILELSRAIHEYTEYGAGPNLVHWGKELLKHLVEKYEVDNDQTR